jgi:hypothetical protein
MDGFWSADFWGADFWGTDFWAAGAAAIPAPSASGGGGGGSTQNTPNRRADFGISGKRLGEDEEPEKIEKVARKTADAVIEKAQELAKEKAALNALKEAQQRERASKARLEKADALAAKVAALEADLSILQDDEEVLQLFMKVLAS